MNRIAVLLTCHNRKSKTIRCLTSFYESLSEFTNDPEFQTDIYLTDDGSTDGTAEEVKKHFPKAVILQGSGSLFWANGMRKSWQRASEKDYDGYLLLNDDTELYPQALQELMKAHEYAMSNENAPGIYIGPTEDKIKKIVTYSGAVVTNYILASTRKLLPNGEYQKCDYGNANIMLVPREVVDKIGILSDGYAHGKADYDYTMTAGRAGISCYICPEVMGHCEYDHDHYYVNWDNMNLKERKKVLYSPTGIDFKSQLKFNWKFFPLRWPLVLVSGYFKLLFPNLYLKRFKLK